MRENDPVNDTKEAFRQIINCFCDNEYYREGIKSFGIKYHFHIDY